MKQNLKIRNTKKFQKYLHNKNKRSNTDTGRIAANLSSKRLRC